MAWHEGKPEYRSSPNSKEVRENFAYLKNHPALPPVGSKIAYSPGYFTNGSNGGFTYRMVSANTVAAVNALLNPSGWYVCDGAALNDPDSPIFNGAGRYLPNITDDRFLMGDTVAGGIGGTNSNDISHTHTGPAHTHSTASHALVLSEIPSHRHQLTDFYVGTYLTPNTGSYLCKQGSTSEKYTGYSGGGAAHNHGPTGSSGTGATSSSGNPSLENRPNYLSCFYIMRVK